jgi:hypothetical protein
LTVVPSTFTFSKVLLVISVKKWRAASETDMSRLVWRQIGI